MSAGNWIRRVSDLGTAALSLEEARKVRALNQFALIGALSVSSYGLLLLAGGADYFYGALVDFVAAVAYLATLLLTARRKHTLAVAYFLAVANTQLYLVSSWAGPPVGFHYYFIAFATAAFLIVPRRIAWLRVATILSTGLFVYFAFVMDPSAGQVEFLNFYAVLFRIMTAVATCATLALIAFIFDRDATQAEMGLEREHQRSEELLLNILPPSISERLKEGEKSIADGFANVSVLFADIVGFTQLSARMPPDKLVLALNQVFSAFDDLAVLHGLEKIKTIGDAYMAAAGLPEERADHAVIATRMAVAMTEVLARINESGGFDLNIRIGIHSGPVVAGVIGKKKFIYDLWGDTVNTASRMESHGEKGRVQVSEVTSKLLQGHFELEPREPLQIKGKGLMQTYLVRCASTPA